MLIRVFLSIGILGCGAEAPPPAPEPPPSEAPAVPPTQAPAGSGVDDQGDNESASAPDEPTGVELLYQPVAGSIRFVVIAPEAGLLGSEQRAVEGMQSDLRSPGRTINVDPPAPGEVAAVETVLGGGSAARPPEWAQVETVVALAYSDAESQGSSDGRHSVGPRGFAIFRGASMTPRYLSRIESRVSTYGYNLNYSRPENRAFIKDFIRILDGAR